MTITVSAFYKFVAISDPAQLRVALEDICRGLSIKGTILVAHEGINGTVAGSPASIDALEAWLKSDPRFAALAAKHSVAAEDPFQRLKIKIKPEIVTMHAPEADPTVKVGQYVASQDWNALIQNPDVVLVDTRNSYEVAIGSFQGAIDPGTRAFHEFPDFVRRQLDPKQHKKVAMFCTGGIRCEKASAYMLQQGFEQVFHLDGGILKYLETMPVSESLWQGECFVFDERVAVQHGLAEGHFALCPDCGHPVERRGEEPSGTQQAAAPCRHCTR